MWEDVCGRMCVWGAGGGVGMVSRCSKQAMCLIRGSFCHQVIIELKCLV